MSKQLEELTNIIEKDFNSERKTLYWVIGLVLTASLIIGPPTWALFVTMSESVESMKNSMISLTKNMNEITIEMNNMSRSVERMSSEMNTMNHNIYFMSNNVQSMTYGVNRMSTHTKKMSKPSTFLNPMNWMP
jgi:methyl-accepting chemotaxis protein